MCTVPLRRLGRDRGDGRRHVRPREPAGEQLFELALRLPSRLGEELLGVVVRQVAGEQEQPRQVELAAREVIEHLRELLDQAGHADAFGGAVLGVAETLGAVGEEGGARFVEIDSPAEPEELASGLPQSRNRCRWCGVERETTEPAAVELCQVEDDVGARRPLRAHGGREPLAKLVVGDRGESVHALGHITRFFELAADAESAFRASERVARRREGEHMLARQDARARGHHPRGR